MTPMADPEISEIREARHNISAEMGHDIRKLASYYRKLEEAVRQSGDGRFISQPAVPEAGISQASQKPGSVDSEVGK